jgi:hypothetical protein
LEKLAKIKKITIKRTMIKFDMKKKLDEDETVK